MKISRVPALIGLSVLATGGVIGTVVASRGPQQAGPVTLAAVPVTTADIELLAAVPFALDEPFVHEWRAEKPLVASGYLLQLRVDPELSRPRQTYEPVLYVGAQTAERCLPEPALALADQGILVVLVPAPLDGEGRVALDLDTAPVWFGSLELPERVDAARITAELAAARARGVGPAQRHPRAEVRTAAADVVRVRTRMELEAYVLDLLR
jgi:hypothetical protein